MSVSAHEAASTRNLFAEALDRAREHLLSLQLSCRFSRAH